MHCHFLTPVTLGKSLLSPLLYKWRRFHYTVSAGIKGLSAK